jgi:hypothetical protein
MYSHHSTQQHVQHIIAQLSYLLLCGLQTPAGSWDKTLKHCDLRTPIPVFSYNLPRQAISLATH